MLWKEQLKNSIHTLEDLHKYGINIKRINKSIINDLPLFITPHYLNLIDIHSNNDPLKKIVIPSNNEFSSNGAEDIMGEQEDYKIQGLQHKYPQTALLIINNSCASYCRYCFRKRLFKPNNIVNESLENIEGALDYIRNRKEINNVLFSGGDPLTTSTKKLDKILSSISTIEHIKYVRIGTKILAYLPQRILEDNELISIFKKFTQKKALFMISHFDHENEISIETVKAIKKLLLVNIPVLSQTVLLKDVNDNVNSLQNLFNSLVSASVMPYYIFQAMPLKSSMHFQIPIVKGIDLINEINTNLSGIQSKIKYIIPHYIGKIEAIGFEKSYIYFKYHRARKSEKTGNLFKIKRDDKKTWFNSDEIIQL